MVEDAADQQGTVGDTRRCLRWTRPGEDRLRNVERSSCGKRGDVRRRKMEEEKGGGRKSERKRYSKMIIVRLCMNGRRGDWGRECMYVCNAFKDTRFNDSQQMFTKMINK